MEKLTEMKYWDKKYSPKNKTKIKIIRKFSSLSLFYLDLKRILKKYIPKKGTVLEVGCAPAIRLINISKDMNLEPYGIDYSPKGVKESQLNFKFFGLNPKSISKKDFFDEAYLKKNEEKYDVVMSFGFIEHFDDVKSVIKKHVKLLKKEGKLILSIPNLCYGNRKLTPKEILEKHNLKIMKPENLLKAMPESMKILRLQYYGGPFNVGTYFYKNPLYETIRKIIFLFQRIIIDPILILLLKLGIKFNNKVFSPSIIIIAQKNE